MSKRESTPLTPRRLRTLLHYDPRSGVFIRRTNNQRNHIGDIAGGNPVGRRQRYSVISVENRRYQAHRIAWAYMYGRWPTHGIDHIDGDPLNNRIANLRDVYHVVNCQNVKRPNKNNTSGYLGVYWSKQSRKWFAKINVGPQQIHLGTFSTAKRASIAYISAKRRLHAGCTI